MCNHAEKKYLSAITTLKRLACTMLIAVTGNAMAIEEAEYTVVQQEKNFEIRKYTSHILAETMVEGDFDDAGNKAFKRLFDYISGNNLSRKQLDMTSPVSQKDGGEKIDMTTPVGQQKENERWLVSFMMPASYSLTTLPQPKDSSVYLRKVPARYIAAIRYSGFWSEKNYIRNKDKLTAWMEKQNIRADGKPTWARYNPPLMPWFLRRNEILIPISKPVIND